MDQLKNHSTLPGSVRSLGFYVNGSMRDAGDRETLVREAPGYLVPVSEVTLCTTSDVDDAVAAARGAFESGAWSRCDAAVRATALLRVAAGIRERLDEIAYWETLETGKPITQARAEIGDAAGHYEFCAGAARMLHGETYNNQGDQMFGVVTRQPAGVVGLITPWNFPFIVLAERLPYILASGNSVVVKPSEMTSTTTLVLAEILAEAGIPDGVYNVVTGLGPVVGQAMSVHPDIDIISFTGSTVTGAAVLQATSANFKKASLELGGKNPQIVFADADLDAAADGVAFGLCFNAGQCCVSGSRLIVEDAIAERFTEMVKDKLARVKIGECLDPDTQLGAIVSKQHHEKILSYLELGTKEGAAVALGGGECEGLSGRYIAPTVLTEVQPNMRIAQEEIFGPVLTVTTFGDAEEALKIANDCQYGLAASIWTKDIDKALTLMRGVHAGRTWVNTTIAGGPGQPMGGFKQSGIGREGGMLGIEEYTEVKSAHISIGQRTNWIA